MAVSADRLGGLHAMLDLGRVRIRVAVVGECVEDFTRLPDTHLALVQPCVFGTFRPREFQRLVLVIQPVEVFDPLLAVLVVAKFTLQLCLDS